MASQTTAPRILDEDAKIDLKIKKDKKKFKSQVRKYRRDAENESSELNLTAMMDMMTILLVFLIKSYGAVELNVSMSGDLTPPSSASTLNPIEGTTSVTITKKDVSVGEKGIVKLTKDYTVKTEDLQDGWMPAIKTALETEIAKTAAGKRGKPVPKAEKDKPDPAQMITIVADKDLPYETLYAILKTAGHLDFDSSKGEKPLKFFKFLVISSAG